jgi:hypothetical protein
MQRTVRDRNGRDRSVIDLHSKASSYLLRSKCAAGLADDVSCLLLSDELDLVECALDALEMAIHDRRLQVIHVLMNSSQVTAVLRAQGRFTDLLTQAWEASDFDTHTLLLSSRSAFLELFDAPLSSYTIPHLQQCSFDLNLALQLVTPTPTSSSSSTTIFSESACDISLLPEGLARDALGLVHPYLRSVKLLLVDAFGRCRDDIGAGFHVWVSLSLNPRFFLSFEYSDFRVVHVKVELFFHKEIAKLNKNDTKEITYI